MRQLTKSIRMENSGISFLGYSLEMLDDTHKNRTKVIKDCETHINVSVEFGSRRPFMSS